MRSCAKVLTLLALFLPGFAFSQGILRGTVADSATHELLVGANVLLRGTALGGVTNIEGKFRIAGITPGTYTVRISYIGYKTREVQVAVVDGESNFNTSLLSDVIEGEEVVVTAQMRQQQAAINQQLTSNTIINVISEEKIKELPDANAAEAIGRLPGVSITRSGGEANKVILRGMSAKFTSITIDGIRMAATDANERGVDLSTVSQGSLAGIELFKALTPDKDAEAIAGSVNLVTKKAPPERLIRLETKGAYGKLTKNIGQYDFQARYGERFFDDILGVQLVGNLELKDRSNEFSNIRWTSIPSGDNPFSSYNLSRLGVQFTDETRGRRGASVLLDINTPDSGSIRISNVFNSTNRDYTVYNRSYSKGADYVGYNLRTVEQDIKTFTSSIRGENYLLDINFIWGLSFAQSFSENPYDYELLFDEPSSATSGMRNSPIITSAPEQVIPYAWNNFAASQLDTGYFRYEKNRDKEKTAFLDLKKEYSLGDFAAGEIKIGGKYRIKDRFRDASTLMAPYWLSRWSENELLPDGTYRPKNFAGTRFANLRRDGRVISLLNFLDTPPPSRNVLDRYALNPLINKDALREWYELNKYGALTATGSREYEPDGSFFGDFYDVVERVSAGYLMNTFKVGEWMTLIAGLRVESENNDYTSRYTPGALSGFPVSGRILDTTTTFKETVWLPNIQAMFKVTDFMNLRFAAYRALARPDYNMRLDKFVAVQSSTSSITIGNSRLRAAKAWNYEINTSFFNNDIGLVSVSAFYKDISDMYHMFNAIPVTGNRILDSLGIKWRHPFQGNSFSYNLTYPFNSDKPTKVWGLEFEHQANLNFLPGLLHNLVLNYNFSIVRSETFQAFYNFKRDSIRVVFEGDTLWNRISVLNIFDKMTRLEDQPAFFGNISLGYDIAGLSTRLSLFHQADYTRSFAGDGNGDRVVKSYSRLDFSVKQKITDFITVFLNLNNLTGTEEPVNSTYITPGWDLPVSSQRYGLTGDFGVRVEL
jgi:TonB-dependent receptor